MNTPIDNIIKVAHTAGSILGISKNLLGGPNTMIEYISPGGLLGDLERTIKDGHTTTALKQLAAIRAQISDIQTHVQEIN
jgi:hypothetical protein